MKHKAQEHLDILECKVYENSDRCEHYEKYKCIKCSRVESLVNLQDLINCQFTTTHLYIMYLMITKQSLYNTPCYFNENDIEKLKEEILDIINIQNEMWVSENE